MNTEGKKYTIEKINMKEKTILISIASRRQCNDIFKVLKEKILLNLELYICLNSSSKMKSK